MNVISRKVGQAIEFGIKKPLPLRGFPLGKTRIRMRNDTFTVVDVRPPEGGIRRFSVEERDGEWYPASEVGANRTFGGQ